MSAVATIVGYTLRESLRRRVFLVVLILTMAFLGLYALGTRQAFKDVEDFAGGVTAGLDATTLAGATLFARATTQLRSGSGTAWPEGEPKPRRSVAVPG